MLIIVAKMGIFQERKYLTAGHFANLGPSMKKRELQRPFVPLGFTLTELLVVVAIIAMVAGLLLPALVGVRQQSMTLRCLATVKHLCASLQLYANQNKGLYPPNNRYDSKFSATANWYDVDRIGPYTKAIVVVANPSPGYSALGGPKFVCPSDDNSLRSYAMNVWASSSVDASTYNVPAQGALWRGSGQHVLSSRIILVAERWSSSGSSATGYYAPATIGTLGAKPGLRFGVGGGVSVSNLHWRPNPISELPYQWHRRRGDGGGGTQSFGRVNIGYMDGHVENKTIDALAVRSTGLSTGDSLWSPLDYGQNR